MHIMKMLQAQALLFQRSPGLRVTFPKSVSDFVIALLLSVLAIIARNQAACFIALQWMCETDREAIRDTLRSGMNTLMLLLDLLQS